MKNLLWLNCILHYTVCLEGIKIAHKNLSWNRSCLDFEPHWVLLGEKSDSAVICHRPDFCFGYCASVYVYSDMLFQKVAA